MIAARQLSCVVVLIVACGGCGYALKGSTSTLPPDVATIAITSFENRTTRPEIEQRVTEAVAREFSKRRRYKVVHDVGAADAVLEGAVTRYETRTVSFSDVGRATRIESAVTLQATLRKTADDEVLWSQSGLIFTEQFDVPATGEFFDQETIALDDIARGAAGALVTSVLENF